MEERVKKEGETSRERERERVSGRCIPERQEGGWRCEGEGKRRGYQEGGREMGERRGEREELSERVGGES